MSLNQATLVGNVGQIYQNSTDGKQFIKFSIACSEKFKDKNGQPKEKTNWFNVAVYNDHLKEVVLLYLKKGHKVLVQGSLQNSTWKKDGIERKSTEICLSYDGVLEILTPKEKTPAGSSSDGSDAPGEDAADPRDDDEVQF